VQHLGHRDHAVKAPHDLLGAPSCQARHLDIDHQLILVALQATDMAALRHHAEQGEDIKDTGQRRGLGGSEDGKTVNPFRGSHDDDPSQQVHDERQAPDP
jgi:hypothetical protein